MMHLNKKLKTGEIAAFKSMDGVTEISWKRKRFVFMLSKKHTNTTMNTSNRTQKNITKPQSFVAYKAGNSSVDLCDQMIAYQTPLGRTLKLCRKVVVEVIYSDGQHKDYLYKECVDASISILEFRNAVTYKLCETQEPSFEAYSHIQMMPRTNATSTK